MWKLCRNVITPVRNLLLEIKEGFLRYAFHHPPVATKSSKLGIEREQKAEDFDAVFSFERNDKASLLFTPRRPPPVCRSSELDSTLSHLKYCQLCTIHLWQPLPTPQSKKLTSAFIYTEPKTQHSMPTGKPPPQHFTQPHCWPSSQNFHPPKRYARGDYVGGSAEGEMSLRE